MLAIGGWLAGRAAGGRRARGGWWWRVVGAPLAAEPAREWFATAIWDLIRGAAPLARPSIAILGRRYSEVLAENLGQPGFRELVLVATDLDARRDIVAALLARNRIAVSSWRRASGAIGDRRCSTWPASAAITRSTWCWPA